MPTKKSFRERVEKTRQTAKLRLSVPKRRKLTSEKADWYAEAKGQIAITSAASGGVTLWVGRVDDDYD